MFAPILEYEDSSPLRMIRSTRQMTQVVIHLHTMEGISKCLENGYDNLLQLSSLIIIALLLSAELSIPKSVGEICDVKL
jgi:hypothetical protein